MELAGGARLGPYEIISGVGAGGMGEVYRARDTRLNRIVAIKVILGRAAASSEMRARFEREARAIALVSHPNICTLYDVGHHEGTDFLVMEYLEGETLAARLSRQKALPLDETLSIATQLADALAAAHRAGVVHRDLKPGNIMLTSGGVKVLDFGLAKLHPFVDQTGDAINTTVLPLSGAGELLGTVPYMAPEQLEGRNVDVRTDIFAFGGILYEMAAGRPAFVGRSRASLIAAILDRPPEPMGLDQPLVPPGLERLVIKCLAKDPDARWQSASDVADQLRWLSTGDRTPTGVTPAAPQGSRFRRWTIAAVIVLLATAAFPVWQRWQTGQPTGPSPEVQYTQTTFAGDVRAAALSPDGRTVAYATGADSGGVRVMVRDLAGGEPLEIWKGTSVLSLRWLPNGSQLLAGSTTEVWLISRLRGVPKLIGREAAYLAPSPDGSQLVHGTEGVVGYTLSSLDGTGTATVRLPGLRGLFGLEWNPASNRVLLLTVDHSGTSIVWSVTPDGQDVRRLYADTQRLVSMCSSPIEDVAYVFRDRGDNAEILRLAPLDRENANPTVLATGPGLASRNDCTVSADGNRLLYLRTSGHSNLWRLDLQVPAPAARQLTSGTSFFDRPKVSPDGQWMSATRSTGSNIHVVKFPSGGGEPAELTAGIGAAWSPNGRQLAFVRAAPATSLWISDTGGLGPQELKGADPSPNGAVTWLPDGRLAWQTADNRNYRIRDLESGHEELLVKNPEVGFVFDPHFSPAGDSVAVYWNRREGDERQPGLWLLSWPSRDTRLLALNLAPLGWSADGDWIYTTWGNTIARVSPRTSKRELVGRFPRGSAGPSACSLMPDRQAVICALLERYSDAWILDHVDPGAHTPRR